MLHVTYFHGLLVKTLVLSYFCDELISYDPFRTQKKIGQYSPYKNNSWFKRSLITDPLWGSILAWLVTLTGRCHSCGVTTLIDNSLCVLPVYLLARWFVICIVDTLDMLHICMSYHLYCRATMKCLSTTGACTYAAKSFTNNEHFTHNGLHCIIIFSYPTPRIPLK